MITPPPLPRVLLDQPLFNAPDLLRQEQTVAPAAVPGIGRTIRCSVWRRAGSFVATHGVLERGARNRTAMTTSIHQEGQAPSGHETSPKAIAWTPRLVAAFLADAAQMLRHLQNTDIDEVLKTCPKVLYRPSIQAAAGSASLHCRH
jgi:hypothetical protein